MTLSFAKLQHELRATYRLERELGGGGMSRVFAAEEVALGRRVALKVLPPELAGELSLERFRRELLTAARLQQANIVPVLSAGDLEGVPWYTMPFVEGRSLRDRLTEAASPMPITEIVGIARDVARALAYAHARGIVHRDIKPENILLSAGTAVVTDFGIAKAVDAARTRGGVAGVTLTSVGMTLGTPAYMAPEQAMGDESIDGRADLYALGCVLHEACTGRLLFSATTPQTQLAAHLSQAPVHVGTLRTDLPPHVADLIMAMLAKEPSARPASADAVLAALDATPLTHSGSVAQAEIRTAGALARWGAAAAALVGIAYVADRTIGLPDWGFPGAIAIALAGLPVVLGTGFIRRSARKAVRSPQVPTGTLAGLAVQAAPYVSWHRTARIGAVAAGAFSLGIVAFLGLRAAGIGPEGSLLANGKLTQSARVVVADFAAAVGDSSLARVASEAVRTALSEGSVVSLLTPSDAAAALQRMQREPTAALPLALARELAEREGAAAVVAGDLTRAGAGWIVGLRLVTTSGEELAAYRATADGTGELLEAIEKVSRKLRGRMGESLASVNQTPDLERVSTGSLEAFRHFAEGSRAVDVERDLDRAVKELKMAIAIDSQFAMAWRKLGVAYGNGQFGGDLRDSAYARAFRYRDRLPGLERLRAEGSYYLSVLQDRSRAEQVYREMQQRFPNQFNRYGAVNFANVLSSQRRDVEAESIARLIPPHLVQRYENLHGILLSQRKFLAADSVLTDLANRFPDNPALSRLRADQAWVQGDWETSTKQLEAGLVSAKRPSDVAAAYGILSGERWTRGRFIESLEARRKAREVNAARGGVNTADLVDSLSESLIDINFRGRASDGLARLARFGGPAALDTLPEDRRDYLPMLYAYALAGRATEATAVLARLERRSADSTRRRQAKVGLAYVRAEVALARKDAAAALRWADSSRTRFDGTAAYCQPCTEVLRARIYDSIEQSDSVRQILDRYLDLSEPARVSENEADFLFLPYALKRSGELHAAAGNIRKAVDRYESLIVLWNKADSEMQPTVRDLRARVASLRERLPR
ncbi:MAG: protein kinase [Gemmatimonadota bacterium]